MPIDDGMAFTLAHFSDPHLPPLPKPRLTELAGKRMLGYLNWTRNRRKYYRREVLDALVRDMQAHTPDHIAMTGDLVNLSLPAEFAPARGWLRSVGAPERVTAIPGNHDAYVRATRHRFVEAFGEYLRCRRAGRPDAFPFLRRRGPVALIGLSSAVPTAPFMATGRLGATQIAALEHILVSLSAEQVFRVLLVHHPLRSDSRPKRLTDSAALIALLEKAWRRTDPARPRPHPFHHVVRRAGPENPVDRRAGGIRAGARPASFGRV